MEIRENIIGRDKRGILSRLFHSKSDKEKIPAWTSDLTRALLVFNVSFSVCTCPLLSARFQTELAINTNLVVTNVHKDVVDIHTAVTDVRHDVRDTHAVVSNTHAAVSNIDRGVSELQTNFANTQTAVTDIRRDLRDL